MSASTCMPKESVVFLRDLAAHNDKEWFAKNKARCERDLVEPARELVANRAVPATKGELLGFFRRLEAALDTCGFLRDEEMRPTMVRNIRAIFQRAGLMSHEVNTLQGIVTGLTERPHASPIPGSRPAKRDQSRPQAGDKNGDSTT